tara:strand:- start:1044 stop:1604 length:561 start_codon:yes stop_codon:yes gene_type:complete
MRRKKNYFLFIVGNFNDPSTVNSNVTDIIHTLTMLLNESTLRYIHHDNLMVCHFQSIETLEEIDWMLTNTLNDDVTAYFLLPKPRQMGIRLDKELEKHLTDLKSKPNTDKPNIDENIGEGFKHIGEIFSSMKDMEDMEIIFKLPNNKSDTPTLTYSVDDILDKISVNGLDSLTIEEKNFLDQESKK